MPPSLRAAPYEMYDQRDDRDDEKNVNQASGDMEYEPAKEPGDKTDDEQNQKQRVEHGDLLFRPPEGGCLEDGCLGSMTDTHYE